MSIRHAAMNGAVGIAMTLVGLLSASAVLAEPVGADADWSLRLKSAEVDTRYARSATALPELAGSAEPVVLQLEGPITAAQRAALQRAGVRLGDYLPDYAYVAHLEAASAESLAKLDFVRWSGPLAADWKLDRSLTLTPAGPGAGEHEYAVTITLVDGADPADAFAALQQLGLEPRGPNAVGSRFVIDAEVRANRLDDLAALPAVQYVEPAPVGGFRNDTTTWVIQSNLTNYTPLWEAGLYGQNQIAGFIDGTIKEEHCAFDDNRSVGPAHRKVVAMRGASSYPDSHGTHCAGTLAGDGGTLGIPDGYDGIAPAAKLSTTNAQTIWSDPGTLYARLLDAHSDGAHVHSNSWGDDYTTAYTTWCQQIDQFSYDHEDDLVVFAATNLPDLRTPENAKNVLAVGASKDDPDQEEHWSGGIGPTADGRRKPEVFAPGRWTQSANSFTDCGYASKSGTSMACPAVAGAAVLARQYFMEGYYPTGVPRAAHALTPSGALLKAVLVNSAVDMTGIPGYPSDQEGWGRLKLDETLYLAGQARRLVVVDRRNAVGLSTGESRSFELDVVGDATALQVTLVFTEPPAAVNAADPVVNNLDLQVLTPTGDEYRGNVFSGGYSLPNGSYDDRNNVEQILLPTPTTGTYTVTVIGTAVNVGLQGYALAITGDVDPIRGDCDATGAPEVGDFQRLASCLTGPDSSAVSGCACADFDADGDVDMADFAELQRLLTTVD